MIPLSRGSFDVIVRIDWLSKRKFVIVCHEKVVRIPLEGDEILRVYGERTLGAAKALMNAKLDEPRISDIPVVRDFTNVFPEDLLGLPPQRQVEFRIVLVPGATSVAKSPYRLAPLEMQELSEQLRESCKTRLREEHEVHLKLVFGLLRKEKLYTKFSKLGDALSGKGESEIKTSQQMEQKGDESLYFMDQIRVLLVGSVMDEAYASRYLVHPGADKAYYNLGDMYCKEWNSGDDQLRLRWMIYLVVLADAVESVRDAIGFEYYLASSSG
ncbi:hypothetical protein Tco_0861325 [Tanacetum coccineum]|uniref:Reverse transcriptase domain-containing protein n=1 Tax=Tanacetum coccineum TaxID=301880 RepID=A0ABQ5BL51_9ASTR